MIVRTLGKLNERGITRLSASYEVINYNEVVSNSNRTLINEDPVLNEAAARLGQSMRETEDELCRDMLAGTASVINCTNGVNGKVIAVLKSLLIDLEILQQDDRAQATVRCAA